MTGSMINADRSRRSPIASSGETLLVEREHRGTARTENRDRFDRYPMAAQVDIRQAPFHLVAQK
jgi:hypothetical protein